MPSAVRQNISTMEKQKAESSNFICTVCGDGFNQYTNVITHMLIHGPLESFTFDGSSNGFEVPREYVLQENGTLTVVNGLTQTQNSTIRPSSPGILPSYLACPIKPVSLSSKDVLGSKPLDFNNSRQGLYCCEVCCRSFNSLQNLQHHQQYRNTGEGYKCTLCCKAFGGRPELKQHLRKHTFERFHCCAHCGKRFVKAEAMSAHMKQNHSSTKPVGESENNQDFKLDRTYTCKKCKLTFFWMTDFQTHSLYHCKGKEVATVFETEVEIELTSKVMEVKRIGTCNGTSIHARNGDFKILKNADNEIESSLRPYQCGLCGGRFHHLTALKEHHKTHQTQEEIKNMTQESLKPFKRLIRKGKRRIRNNNPVFQCKVCSRGFHHSSSLSRHMRYHKGTMHTCEFCGRHFQQRSDVARHVVIFHKAELEKTQIDNEALCVDNENTSPGEQKAARGNYKCLECGKKFGLLCVYQRHLRYHKKERKTSSECTSSSSVLQTSCSEAEGTGTHKASASAGPVLEKSHTKDEEADRVDHAPNHKENSPEHYKCTDCTQTFSCMETYVEHQASHGSEDKGSL